MTTVQFRSLDLGSRLVDYRQAWDLQREIHAKVAAGELENTVLLLEHEAVYTAGKRTEPHERPADAAGTPVVDVDRGGKLTWHGPGQLVAYPIIRLPEAIKVVDFVRRMEEAMIRTIADFGLTAGRVPGRSGVWLAADEIRPERKIAAIGLRVAAQTTMHGVAINADPDLSYYDRIIPCGIADAGTTSIARELGHPVSVVELSETFCPHLVDLLQFEDYTSSPDLHAEPAGVTYGLTV